MMRSLCCLALTLSLAAGLSRGALAQEPGAIPPLPVPHGPTAPQLMPQVYYPPVFPAVPPRPPQLGTREQWQYMGVTQKGLYRPRVILAPAGAYYYYNHQPYPWPTNYSNHYMPYAWD